ncbi:hypothetical protein [Gracilimonas sediminicola]|uniref:Uncharacterized protein n=1 Tax=Gracilimonas sediminicola TaxID=2952158 RepID=A0A9X2L1J2_9BACT|nr:hypothetical protein [Gracilimonas sediminicola]MCP9290524.1 hypothetical protein [Gracilimonas sediminicola]
MRTSVDLPDELMKKAKIKAVEEGISLKDLIIRSLTNELDQTKDVQGTPWKDLKGKGTASGLSADKSGFEE